MTGIIVGVAAALSGTSTANVVGNVPDIGTKKKALYLEHGKSINGSLRLLAGEFDHHFSHISHESSAKTQSISQPQTDKGQKVTPVENKAKAATQVEIDKTKKIQPVENKAKAAETGK